MICYNSGGQQPTFFILFQCHFWLHTSRRPKEVDWAHVVSIFSGRLRGEVATEDLGAADHKKQSQRMMVAFLTHTIHVWCIYPHLVDFYGN